MSSDGFALALCVLNENICLAIGHVAKARCLLERL